MEFAPHAAWLLVDVSLDPSNCGCQYCRKKVSLTTKPQKSVIAQTRVSARRKTPTSPRLGAKRINRTTSSLSHASSCSTGRPPLDIYLRRVQPLQRDHQLCFAPPEETRALYRARELVWLILEHHISVDIGGNNRLVHLWPGVVEQSIVAPSQTSGDDAAHPEIHYLVKVLSLDRTYRIPQRSIAPFQTHSTDENILQIRYDMSYLTDPHNLDPFPQWSMRSAAPSVENQSDTEHILALFLFDVKVARTIASFWSVTEAPSRHSLGRPVGVRNAVSPSDPCTPSTTPQPLDTAPPTPIMAESDPYRGLWWGAERIQPGDFLRLSFTESRFTYTGAASAHLADDPSIEEGKSSTNQGRSRGCMFLRLRTLMPIQENASPRSLDAVGQLYKLAPVMPGTSSGFPKTRDETGLPPPPEGYAFRRILTSDWEVQLSLSLVKGRYYPRLKSTLGDSTGLDDSSLQTMEGLATRATVTPRHNVTESREEIVERAKYLHPSRTDDDLDTSNPFR